MSFSVLQDRFSPGRAEKFRPPSEVFRGVLTDGASVRTWVTPPKCEEQAREPSRCAFRALAGLFPLWPTRQLQRSSPLSSPFLLSFPKTQAELGDVGKNIVYGHIRDGRLHPIHQGRRTMFVDTEVRELVMKLAREAGALQAVGDAREPEMAT